MYDGPQLMLKACPRCHGDLSLETDRWGTYWGCLQCGHHIEIQITRRKGGNDHANHPR